MKEVCFHIVIFICGAITGMIFVSIFNISSQISREEEKRDAKDSDTE